VGLTNVGEWRNGRLITVPGWRNGRRDGLLLGEKLMYDNCRVYGPYERKDGRQHVVLVHTDGSKQTVSYPKFLMEERLGRALDPTEVVHHIDHDFRNNSYSNLQILRRADHARDHAKCCDPIRFVCPLCGKRFELVGRRLSKHKANRAKGCVGPFCSRSCASRFTQLRQLGRLEVISPRTEPFAGDGKSGGS
jgi:hypothetical protein